MVRLDLFGVRLGWGLIIAFGVCGALVGVAGCNTQSLVPADGGAARGGTGGGSGSSGGDLGTTGAGGDGTSGFGGIIGSAGAGGITGAAGTVGITGAAGFNRPGVGGVAGYGPGVGGVAGHGPSTGVGGIAGHGPSTGVGGSAGHGSGGGGGSPVDASTTTPPDDAGACQCLIGTDGVLRMSWDCFSTNYQNGAPMSGWCGGSGPGGWVSSCGLDIFKLNRDNPAIPDDEWVYDATGTTVGQQIAETIPVFVCPSDPSLKAAVVAGGQFPPAGCAVENCTCGDAGAVNCPMPDAGATINPF
jgi:hypothetical protein